MKRLNKWVRVLPIVYSFVVTGLCYVLIEWNERKWHIRFSTMKGKKMLVFAAAVWIATVAIAVYAYPRIDEFANIWNDYLLP